MAHIEPYWRPSDDMYNGAVYCAADTTPLIYVYPDYQSPMPEVIPAAHIQYSHWCRAARLPILPIVWPEHIHDIEEAKEYALSQYHLLKGG